MVFDGHPLLRKTTGPVAVRFDHNVARQLRDCDDVRTFTEGGQFYIMGFKDRRTVVYAHSNAEEYRRFVAPTDEDRVSYPGYP